MKGGKTHAWNFDAARENLREKVRFLCPFYFLWAFVLTITFKPFRRSPRGQ